MDRLARLKRVQDVERVRQQGRSFAHPLMVVVAQPSDLAQPRFAFIAGKRVGGAVQRNRAKRRLRAAARELGGQITAGWDLVLIARKPMVEAAWPTVLEVTKGLLQRAGAMKDGQAIVD